MTLERFQMGWLTKHEDTTTQMDSGNTASTSGNALPTYGKDTVRSKSSKKSPVPILLISLHLEIADLTPSWENFGILL